MAYKSLVTVYTDKDRDTAHLEAAVGLARRYDAHLHVVALGIDRTQPGAYFAGAQAIAMQSAMSDAIAEAKAAEKSARANLSSEDITWDVTGTVAQFGAIGQVIARHATLADLVVLPKPYGPGRTAEDVAVLEAALFSTRTPILVLPHGMDSVPELDRVVLAWNQGTESLAAIRAALPMLKDAYMVNMAIIDPPAHDPDRSDPGGHLAEMLSRHGVRCDISVLARTMPRISDVLDRHAADVEANLVVMGAYGHSRFREAILGGATRNMLEKARTPVLMAH